MQYMQRRVVTMVTKYILNQHEMFAEVYWGQPGQPHITTLMVLFFSSALLQPTCHGMLTVCVMHNVAIDIRFGMCSMPAYRYSCIACFCSRCINTDSVSHLLPPSCISVCNAHIAKYTVITFPICYRAL